MLKEWKFRIIVSRPFIWFLYHFIRTYSSTFRLTIENEGAWRTHIRQGGKILLCTWHQQFFSAIRHFQKYSHLRPGLMISRSFDGDIIAGVAKHTGWYTMRGSSSRGGRAALGDMIMKLKETGLAAHIVDGPRGPAGIVKAGAVRLANAAGAAIVPFYVSADRAWYFRSWDRFMLPKPFARVTIRFGDIIPWKTMETEDEFEIQRNTLENIMSPSIHLDRAENS
ncbi:MAG: lysophospholipid acyltransferase family protein [Deltaproteobacteria bacterium]|nr:lysophospholipid acyltransferase family protein [Deltaproteobacteria bacterium]